MSSNPRHKVIYIGDKAKGIIVRVRISKKALNELVDILVEILHSIDSQKVKLDDFLIRVSVLPFYTEETLLRRKEHLKLFIEKLDEEAISKFHYFNQKYLEWLKKYYPDLIDKYHLVVDFEKENSSFEDDESDDFFDFESEEIDESINNMHYNDDEKISAVEFMQEYGIDEDVILDMQNYLKEYDNMILFHLDLDEEYLDKVIETLQKFIYLLEISVEFKDLAKGLEKLEELLLQVDLDNLSDDYKKLLKAMIEAIFSDIEKWVDEVIINHTAQDIHYLDASLLANITQIEMILKDK